MDAYSNTFTTIVSHWSSFFGLIAAVSATLVGLLFVSVSLHLDIFTTRQNNEARRTAEHTLTNFASTMIVGLLVNVPGLSNTLIGGSILLLGVFGVFRILLTLALNWQVFFSALRLGIKIDRTVRSYLFGRVIYPVLGNLALIGASINLMPPNIDANSPTASDLAGYSTHLANGFQTLTLVTFFLLISALINTWNLMVDLSRFHIGAKPIPQGDDTTP